MKFARNIDLKVQGRMWRIADCKETWTTEGHWLYLLCAPTVPEPANADALAIQWADPVAYPDMAVGWVGPFGGPEQFVLSSVEQSGRYDWEHEGRSLENLHLQYTSLLTFEKARDDKQQYRDLAVAMPAFMKKMEREMDA